MWAIVAVIAILIVLLYATSMLAITEGFESNDGKTVLYSDPDEYYDEFYASFYDALFHTQDRLSYERASFRELLLDGKDKHELSFLDACCGTAPHACWFREAEIPYTGLDSSEGMLTKARSNCPSAKFVKGDVKQPSTFSPNTFSTVLLLQNSIYQFQNPKVIAENAAYWLKPEGFCVVHAVHPNKFDPVLELSSPFAAFSLQKYSDKRVVDSEIYFDDFKYQSKFKKNTEDDDASWNETITFYDPSKHDGVKYREQKHSLTMMSIERLVDIFRSSGFTLRETVDLVSCGREYQYLLYFQK
jgi:SAM-dependent methyltransferase